MSIEFLSCDIGRN